MLDNVLRQLRASLHEIEHMHHAPVRVFDRSEDATEHDRWKFLAREGHEQAIGGPWSVRLRYLEPHGQAGSLDTDAKRARAERDLQDNAGVSDYEIVFPYRSV